MRNILLILMFFLGHFAFAEKVCDEYLKSKLHLVSEVAPQPVFRGQKQIADYPELQEVYLKALELVPKKFLNGDGSYTFSIHHQPVLSIVIPAYKEANRLPESILEIKEFFAKFPYPVEIQLRIEKSPDTTVQLSYEAVDNNPLFYVFPHTVHRGKGFAVKQGMLASSGKYILFMDADLSTPLPEIFKFLAYYKNNPDVDVLIGDRRHPESLIAKNQGRARSIMGKTFRKITISALSQFGLRGIYDTQCGFKMFTDVASADVFSRTKTDGFAFDVEALIYASQLGYQIQSSPIQWVNDERSTVNSILDPAKMLKDVSKIFYDVKMDLSRH